VAGISWWQNEKLKGQAFRDFYFISADTQFIVIFFEPTLPLEQF
jgi:hypothetical protein